MFDDDVWRYLPLGPVPSLALATLGAVAAIYVAVVRSRAARAVAVAMLIASVMIVLASTARGALSNDDGGFSWRLGESIRAELRSVNRSLGLLNVFGNVAMFMPIGWLIAVLAARRPILVGTLCALLLSMSVEVWQMVSGSFGDVDDVMLNGLGGLLGAGAATLLQSLGARSLSGGPPSRRGVKLGGSGQPGSRHVRAVAARGPLLVLRDPMSESPSEDGARDEEPDHRQNERDEDAETLR